jgi:sporulation protein YlmC with PRC-barrel domain
LAGPLDRGVRNPPAVEPNFSTAALDLVRCPRASQSAAHANGESYEVAVHDRSCRAVDRYARFVGSTKLGAAYAELRDVTAGWSTKRQVLGKNVFNDKGETIGKIDDIIVAPDKAVSYAVIGAGGFLGVGRHDVAIPVSQLKENGGKVILPGGSKDAIKALPEFESADNQ